MPSWIYYTCRDGYPRLSRRNKRVYHTYFFFKCGNILIWFFKVDAKERSNHNMPTSLYIYSSCCYRSFGLSACKIMMIRDDVEK